MAKLSEMTVEDIVALAKSEYGDEDKQIELIKALASADFGRTAKDDISTATGGSSRRATEARTATQPTAPAENVGQIDDPAAIQRRMRDEYMDAEEYNKGEEADDDDDDDDEPKRSAKKVRKGEEDEEPEEKSRKKSFGHDDYESDFYRGVLNKGGNVSEKEMAEIIDSAPVIQALTEVNAESNAAVNVKLDDVTKSVNEVLKLVKSQAERIVAQEEELGDLRTKVAKNHNKMLEFIEKSLTNHEEEMKKSFQVVMEDEERETLAKSAVATQQPLRPVANGAIAVVGGTNETIRKSGRLTGDYKTDKRMLQKSLTRAGEEGKQGATRILAEIDNISPNNPQAFEQIVAKMPEDWFNL